MATRRGPRFKECRRLGVNVCGHPKAMNRAKDPAFNKKHKISEYGLQLIEKQKVKAYYNILEKQLVRYYQNAVKADGNTGEQLLISLECRLDNLVYRIGFANSIRMARQMVSHCHILVDGKCVNIPSAKVKVGSTIQLCEKARKSDQFKKCFLNDNKAPIPYLSRDEENFSGTLTALPVRSEIPVQIKEQLVVEFYSK
ncbi:30S ribosomal protein S4 [Treponema sp.]|uniref:30S ribosomal protein S4 n=1 Tax=Treponema sp. TaxID=166 RepID=UPI00298E71DC|nr:30S ribosomal protein S4 [Treponema sp.]MCR5613850.1 30S ribosomal protein S4 [Treponema sp.]